METQKYRTIEIWKYRNMKTQYNGRMETFKMEKKKHREKKQRNLRYRNFVILKINPKLYKEKFKLKLRLNDIANLEIQNDINMRKYIVS